MLILLVSQGPSLLHNVVVSGSKKLAILLGSSKARLLYDHRTEIRPRSLEEDADRTLCMSRPRERNLER
jgi:hypothetical protein